MLPYYASTVYPVFGGMFTVFKLSNTDAEAQRRDSTTPISKEPDKRVWRQYLLDICIVLVMGVLLYCGASWQIFRIYTDAAKYQCYATAFWNGSHALTTLPPGQCAFIGRNAPMDLIHSMQSYGFPSFLINFVESQSRSQPLHALPNEYPLLAIIPFTLGLVAPLPWYQVAFALWMALVAGIIYFVLKCFRSTGAAIAFAVYLVVGSWATAEGRFDLIPAGLTLGALILAGRARWKWAFSLLAVATLLKFYPAVLILPLFLAQQMQTSGKWYSWRRWDALGMFIVVCAVVIGLSLVLSVEGTLAPLKYFGDRPIQVESSPSSLLWLGSFFGYPLHYEFTYGSLNVVSRLSHRVSLLSTFCLGVGLLYTFWLQWRGKLDVFTSSLLTLLIIIATGKVFSPQYLIWIAPLVAYVGQSNWKWLLSWGSVGLLTTAIYPYIYNTTPYILDVPHQPAFFPVVFVRNVIMLGFIIALLYRATRKRRTADQPLEVQAQG